MTEQNKLSKTELIVTYSVVTLVVLGLSISTAIVILKGLGVY